MLWCCCGKPAEEQLLREVINMYWAPSDIDNELHLWVGHHGGTIPYTNPVPMVIAVGDAVLFESDDANWYGWNDVRLSMRAFSIQTAPGGSIPMSAWVMPAYDTRVRTTHGPPVTWSWPTSWGSMPGGPLTTANLAPAINRLFDNGLMNPPQAQGKIRFVLYTSAQLTRFPPWNPPWGMQFNYITHFLAGDFIATRS